jgi:hypothetical protein
VRGLQQHRRFAGVHGGIVEIKLGHGGWIHSKAKGAQEGGACVVGIRFGFALGFCAKPIM